MRRIALCALLSIGGCNFALKHPGVTAGTVAGGLSVGMCEMASEDHAACFGLSAIVGVGLALITGAAVWLGTEPEPEAERAAPPPVDWSRVRDTTPVPPAPPPPAAPPPEAPLAPTPAPPPPPEAPLAPTPAPPPQQQPEAPLAPTPAPPPPSPAPAPVP